MSYLYLAALAFAAIAHHSQAATPPRTQDTVLASSNRRYTVRFSGARSDGDGPGKLWGAISVRDRRTGRDTVVRVANGDRGKGNFEAFSLFEDSRAWSPDGLFFAYWDDSCTDKPAVPGGEG